MTLDKLKDLAFDISNYTADDLDQLNFMSDDELEWYQKEVEEASGNLSDWEHLRAVLTFKNKIKELKKRIK